MKTIQHPKQTEPMNHKIGVRSENQNVGNELLSLAVLKLQSNL